jgi:hypothetical protein
MRYHVTERFYMNLVGLLGVAIEDNDPAELDIVLDLIRDTESGQENDV